MNAPADSPAVHYLKLACAAGLGLFALYKLDEHFREQEAEEQESERKQQEMLVQNKIKQQRLGVR